MKMIVLKEAGLSGSEYYLIPIFYIGGYQYGNPECQVNGGKYCTTVDFYSIPALPGKPILRIEYISCDLVEKFEPFIDYNPTRDPEIYIKNIKNDKYAETLNEHIYYKYSLPLIEDAYIVDNEEMINEIREAREQDDFIYDDFGDDLDDFVGDSDD